MDPMLALQVLSIRCIELLQQYQGLDAQDMGGHDSVELASLAFQFRRRKAAILQSFVQSQSLLQTLVCSP